MRKGRHWSYDGQILRIFEVYSYILDKGEDKKELYIGEFQGCLTRAMAYEPAYQMIPGRLIHLEKVRLKSKNQILYIRINEYTAHLLFNEGYLDIAKLETADEDENNIFVPMVFNSRRRLIAIRNDLTQAVEYIGPNGRPLMLD